MCYVVYDNDLNRSWCRFRAVYAFNQEPLTIFHLHRSMSDSSQSTTIFRSQCALPCICGPKFTCDTVKHPLAVIRMLNRKLYLLDYRGIVFSRDTHNHSDLFLPKNSVGQNIFLWGTRTTPPCPGDTFWVPLNCQLWKGVQIDLWFLILLWLLTAWPTFVQSILFEFEALQTCRRFRKTFRLKSADAQTITSLELVFRHRARDF